MIVQCWVVSQQLSQWEVEFISCLIGQLTFTHGNLVVEKRGGE